MFRIFFCYIFEISGKLALQPNLEKDFSVLHTSNPLKELVKQKWEELNFLNKGDASNLGYVTLHFIILLNFGFHFVIEKIILLFELCSVLHKASWYLLVTSGILVPNKCQPRPSHLSQKTINYTPLMWFFDNVTRCEIAEIRHQFLIFLRLINWEISCSRY